MNKIEKSKYTGYLWWSHKTDPETFYQTEFEREFSDNENPFIIEGWLTDGNFSINIRYVDGKHLIEKFDIEKLNKEVSNKEHKVEKLFMPNFKGFKELKFIQYWRPKKDEMCLSMEVLQPAEFVFVGLKR